MITTEQFGRVRSLALRLAGIELFERHRDMLHRRSHRSGLAGGIELDTLLDAAEADDSEAGRRVVDLITTKFTGFFRHPRHFEIAAEQVVRAVRECGAARCWSAACATGEEPNSMAMTFLEAFACDDPPVAILATDISEVSLAAARRGEYAEPALQPMDSSRRARFFTNASAAGWQIVPEVRRLIEYQAVNLASVEWPVVGLFDVIFCRNVLMYFEACHRYAVLERMVSLLAPDGLLILDPTEHPGKAAHLFTPAGDGVSLRRRAPVAKGNASSFAYRNRRL